MEELTVNVRMTIAGERNFFLLCGDMFLLVSERNGRQEERKIVYAKPKEFDTSLLKETWLIRSDVALENYYPIQKKEANYYWIENQDMSIIKKVKELDKNSFIALWR